MKLVIIDGQSGRMGALLTERVKAAGLPFETLAVGTNAIATAAMMKAGADRGATGENPVLVACRDADIIAGPIGILMADALMGEITPAIAVAIGQSRAQNHQRIRRLHPLKGLPGHDHGNRALLPHCIDCLRHYAHSLLIVLQPQYTMPLRDTQEKTTPHGHPRGAVF